jgi:hypothetical protein
MVQSEIRPAGALHHAVLQRACACGTHTIDGACEECRKSRGQLQRSGIPGTLDGNGHAPPLRVSQPGDADEVEADAIAQRIVAPRVVSGTLPTLQTKLDGTSPVPDGRAALARDALLGAGQPLDSRTRAEFEPRFSRDLSRVRVHTDTRTAEAAGMINARAYTLGSNIGFARGEYQPDTPHGRTLIAHELAHVLQQDGAAATIRRKIKCDPRASLDAFLWGKGVRGVTQSNSLYDRGKGGETNFEQEMLIDMLSAPRVFHVDGDSEASASANLSAHLKARTGVVIFAAKKQYNFAALSGWSMNPAYYDWDVSKGTWKVKPGVDPKVAWEDVNINPKLYAIGCAAATDITLKGGSGGANIIDMPSGDQADWVAGDAGYIENTKYPQGSSNIGLLGENIIYTGGGKFWGHFTGTTTYRTLTDWIAMVTKWNGGARVDAKRELPATGLLDK